MRFARILCCLLASSILYSCEKDKATDTNSPDSPTTPSSTDSSGSAKQIQSVVFRVADNSALAYDVSGMVGSDTVKVVFAPNTVISNLLPDITFLGQSISPLNKTARDFTSPATYIITAKDGSTKKYVFACTVAADSAAMLVGKWSVIKDSSTNDGFVTSSGVYVFPGVYTGIAEDYWEFTTAGIFNMHANNQTGGGFLYHILPNAKLYIDIISSGFDDGNILALTPNKAIFFWTKSNSSGKKYSRMVYLKK